MNVNLQKGVCIMLAVIMAATIIPFFTDSADANSGDTEDDPLVWWNKTIILLPEVKEGTIVDEENETLTPPENLAINWGDGKTDVKEVDGYVNKGDVEIVHTYEDAGKYHITCTPQKSGYVFKTYELYVEIMGAPTVYFYDGETEITKVVAENGYGVGEYADNYFTKISAPENPTKEGYTFDCWYLNGEKFDFNTIIKTPITLQAKWTEGTNVDTDDDNGKTTSDVDKTIPIIILVIGLIVTFVGFRIGNPIVMAIGAIVALFGGLVLVLALTGTDLIGNIKDILKGGKA